MGQTNWIVLEQGVDSQSMPCIHEALMKPVFGSGYGVKGRAPPPSFLFLVRMMNICRAYQQPVGRISVMSLRYDG